MAKYVKKTVYTLIATCVMLLVPSDFSAAENNNVRVGLISDGKYGVITSYKEYGCKKAQGYYFSRPIPDEEFSKLL